MEKNIIRLIFETLFLGFGISMLIVAFLMVFKNSFLRPLLKTYFYYATLVIRFLAIIYFTYYCITLIHFYATTNSNNYIDRATGPYAWSYWNMILRPIGYCLLVQLFWFKRFRKPNITNTVFIVILFTITLLSGPILERFVIFLIGLHRDYLPSGWPDPSKHNSFSTWDTFFYLKKALKTLLFEPILFFSTVVITTCIIHKKHLEKI